MGISSELIALLNADLIEDALVENKKISGVVLDLIKAYNAVPRMPLVEVLLVMGAEPKITFAFLAAMDAMQRVFIIDGAAGERFHTTTGIVEGCSFAVPAMLAISIWAWKILSEKIPHAQCLFFADNWSFVHPNADQLLCGLNHLAEFLAAIRMQISRPKSWLRANHTTQRKILQGENNALGIPVCETAKDLGVQQNYSKKRRKPTGALKIHKSIDKCKQIAKLKIPNSFRPKMTSAAAHSKQFYGAAVSIMAKEDFHHLRTATAAAINRSKGGANPFLACNAIESLDPEFKDITNRTLTLRRYFVTFPLRKTAARQAFQDLNPSMKKATGPYASLILALRKINCHPVIINNSFGAQTEFGFVNLEHISSKLLKIICRYLWNLRLPEFINRKDFANTPFDFDAIQFAFQKLSPSHQAQISAYITGKRMTQDVFKVFRTDISGNCPFCGQTDSRIHRIYQCPNWQQQRCEALITEANAGQMGQNMLQLGLPDLIQMPLQEFLADLDYDLPFVIPTEELVVGLRPMLFLDGSAFCNNHPLLTIAGAAVVQASPDDLSCQLITRAKVLGIVPNSYTAEVFAILLALNHAREADLFSDCITAVEQLQFILETHTMPAVQPGYNHIWQYIFQHLQARQFCGITITKVQAHQNWINIVDSTARFHAYVNEQVDLQAKNVFYIDHPVLLRQRTQISDRIETLRADLGRIFKFVGSVWVDSINAFRKTQAVEAQTRGRIQPHDVFAAAQLKWVPCGNASPKHFDIDLELCARCPYHPIFCFRLLWWARQLQWCGPRCNCNTRITFTELYLDFSLATRSLTPVNMAPGNQRDWRGVSNFQLQDISTKADAKGPQTLAAQSRIFCMCIKWLHSQGMFPFHYDRPNVGRTDELSWLGVRGGFPAFKGRPKLLSGHHLAVEFDQFLRQQSPPARHINLIWKMDGKPAVIHPVELDLEFEQIRNNVLAARR